MSSARSPTWRCCTVLSEDARGESIHDQIDKYVARATCLLVADLRCDRGSAGEIRSCRADLSNVGERERGRKASARYVREIFPSRKNSTLGISIHARKTRGTAVKIYRPSPKASSDGNARGNPGNIIGTRAEFSPCGGNPFNRGRFASRTIRSFILSLSFTYTHTRCYTGDLRSRRYSP